MPNRQDFVFSDKMKFAPIGTSSMGAVDMKCFPYALGVMRPVLSMSYSPVSSSSDTGTIS